jgi:hypothetical protein
MMSRLLRVGASVINTVIGIRYSLQCARGRPSISILYGILEFLFMCCGRVCVCVRERERGREEVHGVEHRSQYTKYLYCNVISCILVIY